MKQRCSHLAPSFQLLVLYQHAQGAQAEWGPRLAARGWAVKHQDAAAGPGILRRTARLCMHVAAVRRCTGGRAGLCSPGAAHPATAAALAAHHTSCPLAAIHHFSTSPPAALRRWPGP